MSDLEARIDLIESRNAIQDLVSTYAQAFDRHDPKLLKTIWAADAPTLNLGSVFGEPFVGLDNILSAADTLWVKTPHMHHWMANSLITIDGETGKAESALDCFVIDSDDGPTQVGGLYTDYVVRESGVWKIKLREFDLHYWAPLSGWKASAGSDLEAANA